MDIKTRPLNDVQTLVEVALAGRLDIQASQAVKTELHRIIETDAINVIVSLQDVTFIDSAGLSALVSGLRVAREKGKDILLVNPNDQAQMLFKLTMLDRIYKIFPTLQTALDAI